MVGIIIYFICKYLTNLIKLYFTRLVRTEAFITGYFHGIYNHNYGAIFQFFIIVFVFNLLIILKFESLCEKQLTLNENLLNYYFLFDYYYIV